MTRRILVATIDHISPRAMAQVERIVDHVQPGLEAYSGGFDTYLPRAEFMPGYDSGSVRLRSLLQDLAPGEALLGNDERQARIRFSLMRMAKTRIVLSDEGRPAWRRPRIRSMLAELWERQNLPGEPDPQLALPGGWTQMTFNGNGGQARHVGAVTLYRRGYGYYERRESVFAGAILDLPWPDESNG